VATGAPRDGKGVVTADQGLDAERLWTAIRDLRWHPLQRVRLLRRFRAEGEADVADIGTRVHRRGRG
jgi:hypothetical protein